MRSRYRAREPEGRHFITSTIVGWLPVFTTAVCCEILAGSFDYCQSSDAIRGHDLLETESKTVQQALFF